MIKTIELLITSIIRFYNQLIWIFIPSWKKYFIAVQYFPLSSWVNHHRAACWVYIVWFVQSYLIRYHSVLYQHPTIHIQNHVLSIYVSVLWPQLEYDKHFVLQSDCLDSARILPFRQVCQPYNALILEDFPCASEGEEAPCFFCAFGQDGVLEVLGGFDKANVARAVVVVSDFGVVERTWLVLASENDDVASFVVDYAWSSQLSVCPVIIWPLKELLSIFRYFWIRRISDTSWTFGITTMLSFEAVHFFELNRVLIEDPMVNRSGVIVSQIDAHEPTSLPWNYAMAKRVTRSLTEILNWLQRSRVENGCITSLMVQAISAHRHFPWDHESDCIAVQLKLACVEIVNI